ncbi:hypothetical protein JAB8_19520 [Janthinobacterium sp. HH106]|uniref:HEAT repeat domain-containing protein n=1 Tax=Janthinobacterium sp. HH106 TaxID=1537278 RepID=UPI0008940F32|nr:HEAT repeat domain-containing protein [Janthinobacterium sp. HH106]OEZ90509.1 hypothetical protein JAB8_19520 [Janthinobacterium sp. HH106]
MPDQLISDFHEGAGSGAVSIVGYEYQIDVSVWLALDLVLASKLTHELVLEPATEEDIEADLTEYEPGRITSTVSMDGYRLIVQAKLRTGDAWTVSGIKALLNHGEVRESAARRLATPSARYLLVTSAALNGETRKLRVRRASIWPGATNMPASIKKMLPADAAGRVAIICNQDEERLATDIKRLLTESFRVPNARLEACRRALRDEARNRMGGAGGGRWTRLELERLIRRHDGYIASSPELEHYVHPTNWSDLLAAMDKRGAALIIGQSGTGKTMATGKLYEELRERIPGLTRVPITLGPQQIRDDKTEPPVLYDIEDPWGRFDFDPASRPWNDQLAGFLGDARSSRMIVATSRLDVAQSAGALDTVKPWLVNLEAEHYGPTERRRLYRTRIDALPRKLQPIAKNHEVSVLSELATPLEIQKFFDALPTIDFDDRRNPGAFVAEAIRQAHQNSIERTVIDQIEERRDVRAAAVVWGLLKANDRLSLKLLRSVEEKLSEHSAQFEKGVSPLIAFFVSARNLRQAEASVTYYHPRVEAGIEKALTRDRLVARKTLRTLIDILVSPDGPGEDWGIAAAARLIAAADRTPELKPEPTPGSQAKIDAWLAAQLAEGGKGFRGNLDLAAAAGSANSNVSEAARFLLHRPDRSFGGMHCWGTAPHADVWHDRLRSDPAVKVLVETFIIELLPRDQDSFSENFVVEAERLAGELTPAFLAAASKAVHYGVTYSSDAIAAGALNDLTGFEAIVDIAADVLTPSEADRRNADETRLAIINNEYSDDYANHLQENEDGHTAGEFLKAYVDRVRTTVGWRKLAEHRHCDRLRYYWFCSLANEDEANADEIAGAVATGFGTKDEGTLWRILTKVWDPMYRGELIGRLVSGHPEPSVRQAALSCLIEREPDFLTEIVSDLRNQGRESRLLEIAIELGEFQHRHSGFKKNVLHERTAAAAAAAVLKLPVPFGEVSQAAIALKNNKSPKFSDAACALIARMNFTSENLRVFRFMVDRHIQMPIADDVRCVLVQSDDDGAAVEAIEAAIRHCMTEEVHGALKHKFAAVISRALKAVATPLPAPLPQHLLALVEAKASPVRKTLVELLAEKPHPEHLPTLLRLVKDSWSPESRYHNEDDIYPIARAAVPAIAKLGAIDTPTADELYRTAIDSRDPDLRYEIFRLLVANAEIDSQARLLDLALNPGRKAVRRAAVHALMAVADHVAPDVIARISARDVSRRIEPVASRLLLLLAKRGDLPHVLAIAETLATNDKRRVLLLLVIWVMRARDLPTANRIATMLPANHPAVAWALAGSDGKFDETMLDDLGDQLSDEEVLLFMAPKKKN